MPDAQTVLDNVLELYLNNTVYAVMLEARVGEHAARMTAMTAATDSTAELIEDLNLESTARARPRSRRRSPKSSAAAPR